MLSQLSVRDAMVREYLQDLEVALAGADPDERAETLASIREHLELAVPQTATSQEISDALAALGAPAAIAAATTQKIPAPDLAPDTGNKIDRGSALLLAGAVLANFWFVLKSFSLILAFVCLVGAFVDLKTKRGSQPIAWIALVLSALALVANPLTFPLLFSYM